MSLDKGSTPTMLESCGVPSCEPLDLPRHLRGGGSRTMPRFLEHLRGSPLYPQPLTLLKGYLTPLQLHFASLSKSFMVPPGIMPGRSGI